MSKLMVLAIVLFIGCIAMSKIDYPLELPHGATNIIEKGNHWFYFELDGNRFLYKGSMNVNGYVAVTQIK